MSPGMRQAWLRSTMISIVEPTAWRTARTAATPSARRSRVKRIFIALNPCSRRASADSARSAGTLTSPVDA